MHIYVGNLYNEITEEELRLEFATFGEVKSVTIISGTNIGRSIGHGFVEMPFLSQGEAAINDLNGKFIKQNCISVIEALPLSKNRDSGTDSKRHGLSMERIRQ